MTIYPAQQQEQPSTTDYSVLMMTTHRVLAIVTFCGILIVTIIYANYDLDRSFVLVIGASWIIALLLIYRGLRDHKYAKFGTANTVTTIRLAGAIILIGTLTIPHSILTTSTALWTISICVALLIALDGVDGYFARQEKLTSDFGARYDMEVDAFLALGISLLLWQTQRADIWVLGLGLMRYAFVAWSWVSPPLRGDLFPSIRRKTVCVIQLGALCLMLSPLLQGNVVTLVGIAALLCLTTSFFIDILWLYKRASKDLSD